MNKPDIPNHAIQVLTAYPLSNEFRLRLENKWGCIPEFISISQLRGQTEKSFIRALRAIHGQVVIALEDPQSQAILPIMILLAHLTRASRVTILYADLSEKISRRIDFIKTGLQFLQASLKSMFILFKTKRQLRSLLQMAPVNYARGSVPDILYLNANLWFGIKAGGSIGHVAGVANGFLQKNYKVLYGGVEKNSMLDNKINFLALIPPRTFGVPYELNYYRFNQAVVAQVKTALSKQSWHFIYQRLSLANYSGVLLSHYFKVPLVLEYNGSEAWIAEHWGRGLRFAQLAQYAEEVCLKHASCVVTVSEVLKDELIGKGVRADRIVCYPNCIDPNIFSPEKYSHQACLEKRRQFNLEPNALVCTFVGTFGRWHGVPVLAQAIADWIEAESEFLEKWKIRFLLVGDGASMPQVRDILSKPQYRPFYRLTGLIPQQDAPLCLAASDILLSPHVGNEDGSRFFGSPTKLFEYMAMAKPIIASNLEQIGNVLQPALHAEDLVKHTPCAANAILCEPGNQNHIINAIRFLAENADCRAVLGENARRKVLTEYTWQHHVKAILEHGQRQS